MEELAVAAAIPLPYQGNVSEFLVKGESFPSGYFVRRSPFYRGCLPEPLAHRATPIMACEPLSFLGMSPSMNCFGLPRIRAAQARPFLRRLPCTSGGKYRHVTGLHVLGIV